MKPSAGQHATIYSVAAAAGVSIKTVSRVLNREGAVRPETREQVLAAVAALNYRPNVSARRLAGSRGYLIGLIFDNPVLNYVSELQIGAAARCREEGYHLLVEPFTPEGGLASVDDMLGTLRLDGVILTPPICDDLAVLELLEARATPYVRIAPAVQSDRAPCIRMDDREAALQMTLRLLELGHRQIGFVQGPTDHAASHLRFDGFKAALAQAGLAPAPNAVQPGAFTYRSGVDAAQAMLSPSSQLTAVFACNDDMALGVMATAARMGLDVPGRLSIAGFDDTPSAQIVWPQLATVRQPVREMATVAADLLISGKLKGEDGKPICCTLDFQLMMRESVAQPAD